MAFSPQFEPDEVLLHDVRVKFERGSLLGSSLRMQLTNRAAWWAATNLWGVVDGIKTAKAPIASIQSIRFGRKSRLLGPATGCICLVLAAFCIATSIAIEMNSGRAEWLMIIPGVGLLAYAIRQMIGLKWNRTIRLVSGQDNLYWLEPSTMDASTRGDVSTAIDTLRNWAKEHGIQVTG